MKYKASKGEANYLIRHMMDTDDQTSAPTNFLSRLSWNEVYPDGYDTSQPNQASKNVRATGGAEGDKEERAPDAGKKVGHQGTPQGGASRTGLSGNNNANETFQSESVDFLDEEEAYEEGFRQFLRGSLPRMMYFPQRRKEQYPGVPPRYVDF